MEISWCSLDLSSYSLSVIKDLRTLERAHSQHNCCFWLSMWLQVRRLLGSSKPVAVRTANSPDVSDPDIVAQQQVQIWDIFLQCFFLVVHILCELKLSATKCVLRDQQCFRVQLCSFRKEGAGLLHLSHLQYLRYQCCQWTGPALAASPTNDCDPVWARGFHSCHITAHVDWGAARSCVTFHFCISRMWVRTLVMVE